MNMKPETSNEAAGKRVKTILFAAFLPLTVVDSDRLRLY